MDLDALWASGHLIDVALAAIAIEIVALLAWKRLRPLDVLGQILAGFFLLLALRFAVTGADYRIVLLLMAASLPAHLFDLKRRTAR